jgi:hypothetical protein
MVDPCDKQDLCAASILDVLAIHFRNCWRVMIYFLLFGSSKWCVNNDNKEIIDSQTCIFFQA